MLEDKRQDLSELRRRIKQPFARHVLKQSVESPEGKYCDAIHVKTNGDLVSWYERSVALRRVSQRPPALDTIQHEKKHSPSAKRYDDEAGRAISHRSASLQPPTAQPEFLRRGH